MEMSADPGQVTRLTRQLSAADVSMDLTMCGLLPDRAEELVGLYQDHGNWNDVKERWFDERRSNRSTRGSSQKIYRVLTGRFKNAPASLPNPTALPGILDACTTAQDKAQVLYPYLVEDDRLVEYVVRECVHRMNDDHPEAFDFSNETLRNVLNELEYADGTQFDYAESTVTRWCEGFRSVMREIGVLETQQAVSGAPPALGDVPLHVATGFSYAEGGNDWLRAPIGLWYLFQPSDRFEELFDRVAATDAWEYIELHGTVQLRPTDGPYDWITA